MKKQNPLVKKVLKWIDENIILLFSGFLLAFIPLFPKIPFFSPIETYIVRIRAEDILILLAFIIYLIQLVRKKIRFKSFTAIIIFSYAIAGLLSVVSSVWIVKTVPLASEHILKNCLTLSTLFRILHSILHCFFSYP